VHHCYLAEVAFRGPAGDRAPVWQATCSPFRNPLAAHERRALRFAFSAAGRIVAGTLARAAGVAPPVAHWRLAHEGPMFENQIGTLLLDGRRAELRFEHAVQDHGDPRLERLYDRRLDAGEPAPSRPRPGAAPAATGAANTPP
jgi:hypothetical protein